MIKKIEERARQLAQLYWSVDVIHDSLSEDFPFAASIRELDGCIAQGVSRDDALMNLEDAKFDYLYSLLEDNLPIPSPIEPCATSTSSGPSYTISEYFANCVADQSSDWIIFNAKKDLLVNHS